MGNKNNLHSIGTSPDTRYRVTEKIWRIVRADTAALISIISVGLAINPAATAAEEVDAAAKEPLKVVVLPARAHVLAVGYASAEESQEWSTSASANLDAAVREIAGARPDLLTREMPGISADEHRAIDEFVSVVSLSGVAINDSFFSMIATTQASVLDRTFGPSLVFLQDTADADYALATFACQFEQTKRVAALGALVGLPLLTNGVIYGTPPTSISYVALFLMDLQTGKLRWFNVETGHEVAGYNFTDLRDPESARKVVSSLLREYPDNREARSKSVAPRPTSMRRVLSLYGEFDIQIPADWRASNRVRKIIRASRDGIALNEISVELRNHGRAFRYSNQKTTRESAPEQVAAWLVEDLRQQELDQLEIIDIAEDTLAGQPAFRVRYSYQMPGCLQAVRVEQVTVGTVVRQGLLLAGLRAPQLVYFEQALPIFEQSIRTVAVNK
jgi:hypothetical protein